MSEFTVRRAVNHWRNSVTSAGFLKRLLLSVVILYVIGYMAYTILLAPLYVEYFSAYYLMISDPNNGSATGKLFRASTRLSGYGLMFSVVFWMIMAATDAAYHKNTFFGEDQGTIPLRFGKSELMVMVVQLIVYVCFLAAMFAGYLILIIAALLMMLLVALFGKISTVLAVVVAVILGVVMIGAYIYFITYILARLSPASALTIRENDIKFPESWKLTKGIGHKMTQSYLLITLIAYLIMGVIIGILGFILFTDGEFLASLSEAGKDVDALVKAMGAHLSTGKSKLLIGSIVVIVSVFYPFIWLACAGIPNLAVQLKYEPKKEQA